ncbi:MAG: outer membrane beta-barrel protein [Emticicia sp.]|nr:outer membrane beta-barrel protein [Emticicia sp.]
MAVKVCAARICLIYFFDKNKLTLKVGTRYEYTTIDANDQNKDIVIPAYGNLVPSVNISKPVGKSSTLKLAYNNRTVNSKVYNN